MKRCFSLASAAVLGLTLLAGTPSFGKGGHGHSGGSGGGGGHAHSSGSGHSGGHAHSSGHPSGEHHSSGHGAPSHLTHQQMTHSSPAGPQTHSHPTHPQPAPSQGTAQHVAGANATSNQSFTHPRGGWQHDHHSGWGAWGVGFSWDYNPYWNVAPGVIVVPEETEIVEREYMTSVAPTPSTPPAPTVPTTPSSNADETGPEQASRTP